MALAEVMVGAGVLLLMLGLASLALVSYLRGTRQLADQEFPADAVARGLQRCCQVLRSAHSVVEPSGGLTTYAPVKPIPPLVVRVRRAQGFAEVGLVVDGSRLMLIDYPGAYNPARPYPPEARYRELGPARRLTVRREGERLRLTLEAGPGQPAWQTGLDFHGVPR